MLVACLSLSPSQVIIILHSVFKNIYFYFFENVFNSASMATF